MTGSALPAFMDVDWKLNKVHSDTLAQVITNPFEQQHFEGWGASLFLSYHFLSLSFPISFDIFSFPFALLSSYSQVCEAV